MLELYLDEDTKPIKAVSVTSFLILVAALCFGYTIYMLVYIRKVFGSQEKELFYSITSLCLASLSLALS
jgi:hypothetical protein